MLNIHEANHLPLKERMQLGDPPPPLSTKVEIDAIHVINDIFALPPLFLHTVNHQKLDGGTRRVIDLSPTFASRVLPHPGGPASRMPGGEEASPSSANCRG